MKKKLTLFLLAMMCTIGTWADNACKNTATDTGYATIQAAVDAVAEGQTIQMLTDVDLTEGIGIGNKPSFTLDLNGHVLNGGGVAEDLINIQGTSLSIIDNNPTATHTQTGLTDVTGGVFTGGKERAISTSSGSASLTIYGCTIISNGDGSADGAGIRLYAGELAVSNCKILNNKGGEYGGGISIGSPDADVHLTNCVISGNTAESGGGIDFSSELYQCILDGCTITNNSATLNGGGAYVLATNFIVQNCTISNNYAPIGGGFETEYSMIKNSTITNNTAHTLGGGIVSMGSSTFEGKVIIKDNKSGEEGSYIDDNLCELAPVTIGESGLSAGSDIGVYILALSEEGEPEGYCGGQFTTNGSASDLQYFISDQADYYTHYNTTDNYLELLDGRTFSDASVTKELLTAAKTAGTAANVTIARTFYKDGYYNSLCLPFSLDATELANGPFAGYKALKKFVSATVSGSTLDITLEDATSIEAGVPYMISWDAAAENIVNPVFESVTITEDEAGKIQHDNADCDGTFIPTTLEKDNQNYLFLGANNTLYWPNTTNPLKGFRCYFEVKPVSGAKHGMPAMFADDSAAGISQMENGKWRIDNVKFIENGKVVIMNNGVRYNAAGQQIR